MGKRFDIEKKNSSGLKKILKESELCVQQQRREIVELKEYNKTLSDKLAQ